MFVLATFWCNKKNNNHLNAPTILTASPLTNDKWHEGFHFLSHHTLPLFGAPTPDNVT